MNPSRKYLKFIDLYISKYHPGIHEITSLDEVLIIGTRGYFFFCYGKQTIIAIKQRKKRIFGGPTRATLTYINDGYYIKGVYGFSNIICPMITLTPKEFSGVMLKWIGNKHPEIDCEKKLYEFCRVNYKSYNDGSIENGYYESFDLMKAICLYHIGEKNDAKRILNRTDSSALQFTFYEYHLIHRLRLEIKMCSNANSVKKQKLQKALADLIIKTGFTKLAL
jgi:hypothetical protein